MATLREYEATGVVQEGKLTVHNRRAFTLAIAAFKDGAVAIRVESLKAARSQPQNRWYWGYIVQALSDHTGYTPDEIHALLKAKFLPKRLAVADGNGAIVGEFVLGGSTTKLDTRAFGEYCEAIRTWAAQSLDVVIPDPHEQVP